MARKHQLRTQRTGTIINVTSKKQESDIIRALNRVVDHLQTKFEAKKACRSKPRAMQSSDWVRT